MIFRVPERPDSTFLRHHYDSYEAGDRIHEIEHSDDNDTRQSYTQSSYRTNPPLLYDVSTSTAQTKATIDPYGVQNRDAGTLPETDLELMMRTGGNRIGQRQHQFDNNDDLLHLNAIDL
jgi:hypothetical protein